MHDIEKPPVGELRGQHIVVASNAVHATHSLVVSTSNIRQSLRPDGFLMMLEMTEALPFIDMIFGLLEGWWLFNDGRRHAIAPAERWEQDLHHGWVWACRLDRWSLVEQSIQKVIIALASGPQDARLPKPGPEPTSGHLQPDEGHAAGREAEAERFAAKHTAGWVVNENASNDRSSNGITTYQASGAVVVVKGATGSLGSHLVQVLAEQPEVATVVCVNRRGSSNSPLPTSVRPKRLHRARHRTVIQRTCQAQGDRNRHIQASSGSFGFRLCLVGAVRYPYHPQCLAYERDASPRELRASVPGVA